MPDSPPNGRKVLLIGWDAADWKIIEPLIEAGKMPSIERLRKRGTWGRLATLRPILSPMLWTTIATGVRPYIHGVHGFSEPCPDTGRVRPISGTTRKVKAVWNILQQNGLKSNVIGWWPSHPAEPISGVMVSNHYQRAGAPAGKPWPMQPGTVHPQRCAKALARLRLHPAELTGDHLLPFVPKATEIDPEEDKRIVGVAKTIADCTTIQAAATAVMQNEPWDFMAVYFDAIDHFGHGFMKYHPPRQSHIDERSFELYSGVMEAGYRYHDMMLGALLQLAGPETTIILMSDHGFHSDHRRPKRIPLEPAGPAIEHSPYGIFVAAGPGIKQDDRVYGATLLDITPTVLSMFNVPIGEDMQGRPLVEIYENEPEIKVVESWNLIDGDCGAHPPDHRVDAAEARESLQQLVDLGYIEDPGENAEQAVKNTVRELHYNLAQAYIDDNLYAEARDVLEPLWQEWPDELRFANLIMICCRSLGDVEGLEKIIEQILATRIRLRDEAKPRLQELYIKVQQVRKERREEAKKEKELPTEEDVEEALQEAAEESADEGAQEKKKRKPILDQKEQRELERLRYNANPSPLIDPYYRGLVAMARKEFERAVQLFKEVAAQRPDSVNMLLTLGELFAELRRWSDAQEAFEHVITIDPEQPRAHHGLGRCAMAKRQNLDAVEHLLESIGMHYFNPRAHQHLGIALHRTKRFPEAIQALRVSLAQNPSNPSAHRRLARIYHKQKRDLPTAVHHREKARAIARERRIAAENRLDGFSKRVPAAPTPAAAPQEFQWPIESSHSENGVAQSEKVITIVSGLPRSGTSMMMQMLAAGGLAPLVDEHRPADVDNPRGYFEYEPAKQLITNKAWLPAARGKVVKLVGQLLPHLPPGLPYRIVFMRREIDEVLRSQQKMLDRLGRSGADLDTDRLAASFSRQLAQVGRWLDQYRVPRLVVPYRDAIDDVADTSQQVADFLGGELNTQAMAAAIDSSLYRQRSD